VVVFVLDSFSESGASHGNQVGQIVDSACYGKCEIRAIDVFRERLGKAGGYLRALMEIQEYMESHPNHGVVLNISLASKNPSLLEHTLISRLCEQGAIVVAAAGNDNKRSPQFPAFYEETVAVAAASGNRKANYSNYGEHVDIAAEGLQRKQITRYEVRHTSVGLEETIYYTVIGGTSFSAPRVSGLIAYILRQRPELTPHAVIELVKENATLLKDEYFQKGLLGAGRISPHRTLRKADPAYQRARAMQIVSLVEMPLFILILSTLGTKEFAHGLLAYLLLFVLFAGVGDLVLIVDGGLIRYGFVCGVVALVPNIVLTGIVLANMIRKRRSWAQVHSQQCREYFTELVNEGDTPFEARVKVSQAGHPELPGIIHEYLAAQFRTIDSLLDFLTRARKDAGRRNKLEGHKVLRLVREQLSSNAGRKRRL
jgi:hypothetical protein